APRPCNPDPGKAFPENERLPVPLIPRTAKSHAESTKISRGPLDGWPANHAEYPALNLTPHPSRVRTVPSARLRECDAPRPDRGPHPPPLPAPPRATYSKSTRGVIRPTPERECALRV